MNVAGRANEGFKSIYRAFFPKDFVNSRPPSPPQSISEPILSENPTVILSDQVVARPSTPPQREPRFPPTPDPTPPQQRTETSGSDLQTSCLSEQTCSPIGLASLSEEKALNSVGWSGEQDKKPSESNEPKDSKTTARSTKNESLNQIQMLQGAQARRLLYDINRLKEGKLPLPKVKLQIEKSLPYDQYKELCTWIETHPNNPISQYWNTELHFDYTCDPPGTGKNFVIRMPGAPHELVIGLVAMKVTEWFKDVKEKEEYNKDDETTIDIAKCLQPRNQRKVYLQNGNEWEPDLSFRIQKKGQKKDHIYPAVVIEVSYTQRLKELKHRAETWIKYSTSKVRTVIGFDLNDVFRKHNTATLYVWKSRHGEPELIVKSEFREKSGRAIPGVNLCLSLHDFLQDGDVQNNNFFDPPNMLISSEDIVASLEDGLEDQEVGKTSLQEIRNRNNGIAPSRIKSAWNGTFRKIKMVDYKSMMKK